jgi:hypothetical protein
METTRTIQDIDTELMQLNEEEVRLVNGLPSQDLDAARFNAQSAGWTAEQRTRQRLMEIDVRRYQLTSERVQLCLRMD